MRSISYRLPSLGIVCLNQQRSNLNILFWLVQIKREMRIHRQLGTDASILIAASNGKRQKTRSNVLNDTFYSRTSPYICKDSSGIYLDISIPGKHKRVKYRTSFLLQCIRILLLTACDALYFIISVNRTDQNKSWSNNYIKSEVSFKRPTVSFVRAQII